MTDPATIATSAVLAKKVALVSGVGGTAFAAIAWWEHLAHFWPIIIAVIVFLVSVGKFMRRVDDMDKSNTEQHKEIVGELSHGLRSVEQKFDVYHEKLNHKDLLINGLERRVLTLEDCHKRAKFGDG